MQEMLHLQMRQLFTEIQNEDARERIRLTASRVALCKRQIVELKPALALEIGAQQASDTTVKRMADRRSSSSKPIPLRSRSRPTHRRWRSNWRVRRPNCRIPLRRRHNRRTLLRSKRSYAS